MMTTLTQGTTAQSLGTILKSAREIMRKNKGLNGDLDWLSVWSRCPGLSGRGDIWVISGSWGFTPSFHITGLQPVNLPGPKLRDVTAWAGASPTRGGHIQIPAGNQPVNLPGPKVCHVTAWAGASPTSEGPGQPSPQTSQAL